MSDPAMATEFLLHEAVGGRIDLARTLDCLICREMVDEKAIVHLQCRYAYCHDCLEPWAASCSDKQSSLDAVDDVKNYKVPCPSCRGPVAFLNIDPASRVASQYSTESVNAPASITILDAEMDQLVELMGDNKFRVANSASAKVSHSDPSELSQMDPADILFPHWLRVISQSDRPTIQDFMQQLQPLYMSTRDYRSTKAFITDTPYRSFASVSKEILKSPRMSPWIIVSGDSAQHKLNAVACTSFDTTVPFGLPSPVVEKNSIFTLLPAPGRPKWSSLPSAPTWSSARCFDVLAGLLNQDIDLVYAATPHALEAMLDMEAFDSHDFIPGEMLNYQLHEHWKKKEEPERCEWFDVAWLQREEVYEIDPEDGDYEIYTPRVVVFVPANGKFDSLLMDRMCKARGGSRIEMHA